VSHIASTRLPGPAVAIAAALLLLSCERSNPPASPSVGETTPTTAPAEPVTETPTEPLPTGPPDIEFTSTRYDFGAVTDAGPFTAAFEFRNAGGGTLIITGTTASCGCTVPQLEKHEYGPGEKGVLNVVFDPSNRSGGFVKYVFVTSNSIHSNYVKLAITADISPLIRFDTIFLRLGRMELGEEHARSFDGYTTDPNLEVTEIVSNNPLITGRVLNMSQSPSNLSDKREYRIVFGVTIADSAPWGLLEPGELTIRARGTGDNDDEPGEAVYTLYLSAELYGDLQADPAIISPNESLRVGDEFDASLVLSSVSGTYFSVIDAVLDDPENSQLEVSVEPVDPSSYRISVHGIADTRGPINGHVTIRTDVPGEETLRVQYGGYVR
jgi:hypothetical protein